MSVYDDLLINDDRPRHPYVAAHPDPDDSARPWPATNGDIITAEHQAWESRSVFHVIEGLRGALTPIGALYTIQSLLHYLTPAALAESVRDDANNDVLTDEMLASGPMLPTVEFERVFGDQLTAALSIIDEILERCPSCGRKHGEVGWIHTQTGKAVQVMRVEGGTVWFRREYQPGQWTAPESMPKDAFERYHVPADRVGLLDPREEPAA